jgi:ABC-type sugar transport system permease subunit
MPWARYLTIFCVDILSLWPIGLCFASGHEVIGGFSIAILMLFNLIFTIPRAFPYRYMFPGILCFLIFMVFPICFTVYIGFTNLGTGHILGYEKVRELLLSETYTPPNDKTYRMEFGENQQKYFLFLSSEDDEATWVGVFARDAKDYKLQLVESQAPKDKFVSDNAVILYSPAELYRKADLISKIVASFPDGKLLRSSGIGEFSGILPTYEEGRGGALINRQNGEEYVPDFKKGYFMSVSGNRIDPGFKVWVGMDNFKRLFRDNEVSGPFFKVFIWTILWAVLSVIFSFGVGITLALLLNKEHMKFKFLYRMLLIIPYSIPFFISILIFKGMLNKDYGVLNQILENLFHLRLPWLTEPFWAKASCILVNVWLSFPYMLLVTTGILQSIPTEVYEAAKIDGASRWTTFWKITMPMVMSAVTPLLIGSFAFSFNNFVGIYLLTGGSPPMADVATPVGETDILISYTYRLAFEGGAGQDFGLASAIAFLIFFVICAITIVNFRYSGMFKSNRAE